MTWLVVCIVVQTSKGGAMRILIIDDDGAVLRMTRRMLASEGHQADAAATAADAFRHLAAKSYDTILCDLHLPDVAAATFLSKLSPLDAARVVFATGGECSQADADFLAGKRVLYKPFTPAQLRDAIAHEAA